MPYANPATLTYLIDFALLLKAPKSKEPIYPLSVVLDNASSRVHVAANRRLLQPSLEHASRENVQLQPIHRVDINPVGGILRTAKELLITDVLIGWNGSPSSAERFFGTILDNLLEQSQETIFVTKLNQDPLSFQRIMVVTLPNCQYEAGFLEWIQRLGYLAQHLNATVELFAVSESLSHLKNACAKEKALADAKIHIWLDWEKFFEIHNSLKNKDLLIVVSTRQGCISYHNSLSKILDYLENQLQHHSFALIFPTLI